MPKQKSNPRARRSASPEVAGVDLEMKIAPAQNRARETIEQIVGATAHLLEEVGIERLSTNLICQHAGITPPALYRYFPNKYAILNEMARRLMDAEDRIVFHWLEQEGDEHRASLEHQIKRQIELNRALRDAAREQPGGVWILRVMRSVPTLREVRAQSNRTVIDAVHARLCATWPEIDPDRLLAAATLSTNLSTATNEMILEDPQLEDHVSREFARMLALYFTNMMEPVA